MWTGDVQGGGYPTQWALNPSAYQNLPNEQVDWATLAQQWIKMKDTFPVNQVPPAPPPPSIKADIEAGEAPMDITKDEINPNSSTNTSQDGSNWNNWNSWQQWNWGWSGSSGPGSNLPENKAGAGVPPYTYTPPTAPPAYSTDTPTATFDYNHGASVPENLDQQGYWPSGPAPFVRNKTEWRSENRGSSNRRHSAKVEEVEPDTTTLLDAAKRKQLPAWIREGLEKMEREKQKKLEREIQLKEREEEMLRRKQKEEEAIAAGIPVKSKFETDSDESEKEAEDVPAKPRRSRFDATSPVPSKPTISNSYSPPPPVKRKTREEIMQDVMQQVRYILTDILMTVTNEEMHKVAEEVLADYRSKAPATQLRKTPALTSLTGKLGLGIYDSDSEDSSAESDKELSSKQENGTDSDEELRERINRKRQEFARIERDIEHQVEQQEEKEREREQTTEEEEPPEDKVDKSQVEPKLNYPGIRLDVKTEELKPVIEPKSHDQNSTEFFTTERLCKTEKESSEDQSEDSDNSSSSDSSSSSSSDSRHKRSKKSSKKRKEKKNSKKKRKRSSSRGSDRRKSSHRKSSRRYEERHRYEHSRSGSRSRSRSRGHHEEHRRSYRHHSSESSHKRHHHSYSHSPDYSRGKKSSHRSRD